MRSMAVRRRRWTASNLPGKLPGSDMEMTCASRLCRPLCVEPGDRAAIIMASTRSAIAHFENWDLSARSFRMHAMSESVTNYAVGRHVRRMVTAATGLTTTRAAGCAATGLVMRIR